MNDAKYLFAASPLVSKSWGMMLLMGIIFLVLGIFYFIQPVQASLALTIIVGALLVFYGIEQLITLKGAKRSGWNLFLMVLAVLIGIFFLASPLFAAVELNIFIGIWMIFLGVDQWSAVSAVPAGTPGRGWALMNAIFSLVFGILVVIFPLFGLVFVGYVIAFYLTIFGLMAISSAFAMRPKSN